MPHAGACGGGLCRRFPLRLQPGQRGLHRLLTATATSGEPPHCSAPLTMPAAGRCAAPAFPCGVAGTFQSRIIRAGMLAYREPLNIWIKGYESR